MNDSENEELDQYGVWVKAPESSPQEQDSSLPDFSFLDEAAQAASNTDDMFKDEADEIHAAAQAAADEGAEIQLDDFITGGADIAEESVPDESPDLASQSVPEESSAQEEPSFDIPDGDVDLDSFFDSPSPAPSASSDGDGEISLDDFMGGGSDGDISLDSFLDPSEFGLESDAKEEEVTYDQPLDIHLTFDDSVSQDADDDAEDSAGTAADTPSEDFDDLFDNIVDEDPDGAEPAPRAASTSSVDTESEEIDLDAFGVGDIDTGFVKGPEGNKPRQAAVVDYDIAVDSDDEDSTEAPDAPGADESSDDENVSIELDEAAAGPNRSREDTDFGAPDDSFDVDSLLSTVEIDSGTGQKQEEPIPDTFDEEAASLTDDFPADESTATGSGTADSFDLAEEQLAEGEPAVTREMPAPEQDSTADDTFSVTEEPALTDDTAPAVTEEPVFTDETTETVTDEDAVSEESEPVIEEPVFTDESTETATEETFTITEEPVFADETTADSFGLAEETLAEGEPAVTREMPAPEQDSTADDTFSVTEEPVFTDETTEIVTDEAAVSEESEPVTEEPVFTDTAGSADNDTFQLSDESTETATEETFTITEEPVFADETTADSFGLAEEPLAEGEPAVTREMPAPEQDSTADDTFSVTEEPVFADETTETVTDEAAVTKADLDESFLPKSAPVEESVQDNSTDDEDELAVDSPALEDNFETPSMREAIIPPQEDEEEDDFAVDSPALEDNFDTTSTAEEDDAFGDNEETSDSYDIPEFLPDETTEEAPMQEEDTYTSTVEDIPSRESGAAVDNTDILKSIAAELASLKTEIAGLKDEFAGLRKSAPANGPAAQQEAAPAQRSGGFFGDADDGDDSITLSMEELDNVAQDASSQVSGGFFGDADDGDDSITLSMEELDNVAQDASSQSTGFFGDADDGDDSIALTGDELSNIVSGADITEEPADIPDDADIADSGTKGLSMDFAGETLEEPVFEEDDSESLEIHADEADGLPEEISVPKDEGSADDIFVESSSSDMLDEEPEEAPKGGTVEDIPDDADADEEAVEDIAQVEYTSAEGMGEPMDLYENDEVQPMTEETFQYLEDTPEEPRPEEAEEESEGAMNDAPAEGVFSQWGGEEEVPTVDAVTKEAPLPQQPEPAVAEQSAPAQTRAIPEEMKQEIKSVLSYMDQLLDSLPEEKITEFAKSEQFETYKKLFTELGLA